MTNQLFLVTVKQDGVVLKQDKLDEKHALMLLDKVIAAVYSNESSAHITRLTVTSKLKDGIPQALEYQNRVMVFQQA